MWCCADQLQRAVERGEYAEAARLLEAVQQLAAHFASFGSVPKVRPDSSSYFVSHVELVVLFQES